MSREPDDGPVERLLDERGQHLMRAAVALTGSRADAEDLLQAALERLLQNWRRIDTDPEGYLRRTLYNLAADGWRRRGRWRGRLAEEVAVVDLRDTLVRLLRQLPPRQRAVVVLRYWEQRTEAETAELLGCTEGTVKSSAARGLRRLRELAGPALDPPGEADSRPPPAPDPHARAAPAPHARAAPAPGGAEPGPRAATCHAGTLKTDLEVAGGRP